MSNFSLSNPIENIGALELNRASVLFSDDALESAAVATSGPTIQYCNTLVGPNCPRRVDDGALEASVGPATPTGGAWTQFCCRRIDDGALEAAALNTALNPTELNCPSRIPYCPNRVDDGELETAAAMTASPSYDTVCASTIGRRCLRDSAN